MGAGVPAHLDTPNLPTMLRQVATEYPGASVRMVAITGRPAGSERAWQGSVSWDGGPSNHRVAVAGDPLEALATALRLVLTYGGIPAPAPRPTPAAAPLIDFGPSPVIDDDLAALLG